MSVPRTGEAPTERLDLARPEARQGAGELVLGRYRLLERIGSGGFGVVWSAIDERLEREVAVKIVPGGRGAADARARREAVAAARLNHPGIVALYELGEESQGAILVSELVAGSTLAELSAAGSISDRDVARIGVALCDALAHAHARGVIHRDLKPQNVLVVDEPAAGAGFAKLADFGVAHVVGGDPLTGTGDVVGTLAYMAPEQCEGRRATPSADVYSLALTLYEAWAGVNPVRGQTPAATARRIGTRLPPLARRRRDLPADLCRAVDASLAPDPELRPAVGTLRDALAAAEGLLDDEGGLVEPGALERARTRAVHWRSARERLDRGERSAAGAATIVFERLLAGGAGGALAFVALTELGDGVPSPELLAAAAGLGVAVLPRVGWAATFVALFAWLAATGHPGTAMLVAAAALPVALLLPRAGRWWSLPVAAPLLGVVGLAPAYLALAGLARGVLQRAALGVLGFLWLALAELHGDERLLFGAPAEAAGARRLDVEAGTALSDGLWPLATSGLLAPALAWGVLAAALPLLLRGRNLLADSFVAALWAAALVISQQALADLAVVAGAPAPRGALAGAALGAVVAVAVASLREPEVGPAAATATGEEVSRSSMVAP